MHTYLAQYAVQLLQRSGFDQVDKAHMDVAEIDRASIKLCINIDLIGFHLLHSVVDRRIWIDGIETRHHVEDSSPSSTISNYSFMSSYSIYSIILLPILLLFFHSSYRSCYFYPPNTARSTCRSRFPGSPKGLHPRLQCHHRLFPSILLLFFAFVYAGLCGFQFAA